MNNEYENSDLNHTTGAGSYNPNTQNDSQPSAYPNVGSSGANTANTARTDYSSAQQQTPPNPNPYNSYTSSFSGGGNNGGYNGYSYSSAPQQPPKKEKKHNKVLLRVLACVGVAALGFGGGLGGAVVASRTGLAGSPVVVQQVERAATSDATATGSTDGTTMGMQQIAAAASPSVVAITTEQMSSSQTWFGGYYVQSGAGSGVIISQDGYILTCAHVVSGATSVKVQTNDGTSYDATIVGSDSTSDVAVLKIDATGLTPAVIGDSDQLAVGETTVAVGNPLGTLSNTVTQGIVSALNRQVTVQDNDMTLIQTDTSISPGNSGGGLFNGNAELIGIVNAKSSYSEAEGIGFAIPINTAMDIAQELIQSGSVARPVLGVKILDISDAATAQQYGVSNTGVYIAEVTKGGGAEAAGVQAGDRILSVDDVAVGASKDIKSYLNGKNIGDTVALQIERDGKVMTLNVELGKSSS